MIVAVLLVEERTLKDGVDGKRRWMDLELGTVEGDITVEGTQGQVNVTSVEGNVRIRGGKGFVGVHTVEGEIDVSDVSGRLEVNSVDGNLSLTDINGDIYAESVDGDITMERIRSAEVEANTVDGDIYYAGSIVANGRYGLDSHDGDITLEVPEPLSASLSVSTFSGSFEACGYAVTMNSSGEPSKRRFRFTLGTGSARVDLESFDGTIRLSKPGCSD